MTRNSEKVSFSRRGRLGAASRLAAKRNFFIKFIEERLRLCFYASLRTCSAVKVSETWCPKPGSVLCPQVLNHELAACPHRFVSHFRLHFHFNPLTCHIERNVSMSLFHENHYITSMEINLLDQCYNSSCKRFTNFSIQSSQIFFVSHENYVILKGIVDLIVKNEEFSSDYRLFETVSVYCEHSRTFKKHLRNAKKTTTNCSTTSNYLKNRRK